jgi:hypothetical protein
LPPAVAAATRQGEIRGGHGKLGSDVKENEDRLKSMSMAMMLVRLSVPDVSDLSTPKNARCLRPPLGAMFAATAT